MSKVRINDLARELEIKSKAVLDGLPLVGVTERKTHSSSVEDWEAAKFAAYVRAHPERFYRRRLQPGSPINLTEVPKPPVAPTVQAQPQAMPVGVDESSAPLRSELLLEATLDPRAPQPVPTDGEDAGTSVPRLARDLGSTLNLPEGFSFYTRGFLDFDHVIQYFDWNPAGDSLTIDLSTCARSNFQTLALLVQHAWYLTLNGCSVTFKYGTARSGSTKMLTAMGALDWREVLLKDGRDFTNYPGQKTFALRRRSDVQSTINNARKAIRNYSIGFPEYMSYLISELLYNATEHGRRVATVENCQVMVPAIFQFGLYPQLNRLSFLFSDLGIGIKAHLEQSYPPFPTHQDAIIYALRPNVSGTFAQQSQPYSTSNNAGMGLTYSSLMLKRLKGDMYIVSQNGVVHVSPEDVTSHQLKGFWPGTFVLINLNVGSAPSLSLEELMSDIRRNAQKELDGASQKEESERYVISIFNYFGKYAEDKDAAITFRDRRLLPAIEQGKKIDLDFRDVETAPHSFLNALLGTAIQRLGMKAYQWIRIYNAPGAIHEIIDKVLEDNLPKIK